MYFYDDFTGHIFHISKSEDIANIEKKHLELGILNKNTWEDFDISDVKYYLYDLAEGFKQLMLEVTSACNFRCKYCTYSDHYGNTRSHGTSMMSFEVAKKAIDYYFYNFKIIRNRNPFRKPIVNFYGGEPLLNYDLIRKCVLYIKDNYGEYVHDGMYHITTNGFLLTDDIQHFLYKNKFNVVVSIDGYKENHDRNRLTATGEKTFDIVFNNYNNMKSKYADAKIGIAACMDYKTNFETMMKFGNQKDIDFSIITLVAGNTGTYYEQFSEKDRTVFLEKRNKIKSMMLDLVKNKFKNKNKFLISYIDKLYKDIVFHPKMGNRRSKVCPYSGSCIMGEKIYVDVNGRFFLCEKVGCKFAFGDVEQGLDFNKIVLKFKKYRDIACKNCKDCNITKLCGFCFKDIDNDFNFLKDKNLCELQKKSQKQMLEEYVTMVELNPVLFDESTAQYYQKMDIGGMC